MPETTAARLRGTRDLDQHLPPCSDGSGAAAGFRLKGQRCARGYIAALPGRSVPA